MITITTSNSSRVKPAALRAAVLPYFFATSIRTTPYLPCLACKKTEATTGFALPTIFSSGRSAAERKRLARLQVCSVFRTPACHADVIQAQQLSLPRQNELWKYRVNKK